MASFNLLATSSTREFGRFILVKPGKIDPFLSSLKK
jgi:hypothetical protein